MTQKELQERNKELALMMGAVKERWYPPTKEDEEYGTYFVFPQGTWYPGGVRQHNYSLMKFHSDWNWLMEAKRFAERKGLDISIRGHEVMVYRPFRKFYHVRLVEPKLNADVDDSSITEAVFVAVSDFATLYNNKEL